MLREDVPDAEPDEAPLLPHVRRECPTIGPDDSVAAALPLASERVREPARGGRRRRAPGGPALPQPARRGSSAWTCARERGPPQRADARRLPAARGVPAPGPHRRRARGRPADHLRRARGALPPARQRPARARAAARRARRGAVAQRAGDPRGALRRAARRRRAGHHQHAPRDGRDRLHPPPLRRALPARRPRARAARRAARPDGHRGRARRRQRARRRPLRAVARLRRPRAARVVAGARGGADLDQLHLGHDGRAQGRGLHAPRRLSERALRGDRGRPHAPERVPLDRADVPLQRLVLHLGRHGGGRAPRDRALGRPGPRLGADRERGRDALQRRPDRAHQRRRASVRASAGDAR